MRSSVSIIQLILEATLYSSWNLWLFILFLNLLVNPSILLLISRNRATSRVWSTHHNFKSIYSCTYSSSICFCLLSVEISLFLWMNVTIWTTVTHTFWGVASIIMMIFCRKNLANSFCTFNLRLLISMLKFCYKFCVLFWFFLWSNLLWRFKIHSRIIYTYTLPLRSWEIGLSKA